MYNTARRRNIETVMTLLDAMRREDLEDAMACFAPDAVWEGLVPGVECPDRDAVREMLAESINDRIEVEHLELIAGDEHVVLGIRSSQLEELAGVSLDGQLFNVFTLRGDRIAHVRDFSFRGDAQRAAGVSHRGTWR